MIRAQIFLLNWRRTVTKVCGFRFLSVVEFFNVDIFVRSGSYFLHLLSPFLAFILIFVYSQVPRTSQDFIIARSSASTPLL